MQKNKTNEFQNPIQDGIELTNPAKRLHAIIEPTRSVNDGYTALSVWATAFGIDPEIAEQDPHDVVERLRMLRDEVDLLRKLMVNTAFSEDLYEPALKAVLGAISVNNLTSQWGNFKPNIRLEHMLALRWCAQAVESEEGLSHVELQRLLDSITEFRNRVVEEELPELVRAFVLHQVDLMLRAIHDYPIRGRQAVRDAVKEAAVDVLDAHDDVSEAAPIAFREKLARFWKVGLGMAESGEKMVKLVTGVAEAVPKLANAARAAADSLS